MVNIYVNIPLEQKIFRLLSIKAGKPVNQRRISLLLDVSQPAVMKALPKLGDFVKVSKEFNRWSIELDRDKRIVIQLKRVDNLKLIYESGLAEVLGKGYPGSTIILFGSYSRGEDTIDSDIDIAIIGSKNKIIDLSHIEKLLERKINRNFYENFKAIHKNLRENLCNGIVIAGSIVL